jgi:hypothetical protein
VKINRKSVVNIAKNVLHKDKLQLLGFVHEEAHLLDRIATSRPMRGTTSEEHVMEMLKKWWSAPRSVIMNSELRCDAM